MHTVVRFSAEALVRIALRDWRSGATPEALWSLRDESQVRTKRQLLYLADHLAHTDVHCRTMVVEPQYIDLGYLDDYADYYARCNASYGRKCVRVHFFRAEFDQARYDALVQGDPALRAELEHPETYLGFLVLKPLPTAFIGRTCVAPYGRDGGDDKGAWTRDYTGLQQHRAHLSGIELSVRSLAYQEQDTVTAACATTAIWCALQKIAPLFELAVPAPAQITRRASEHGDAPWRTMPSEGLYLGQMCRALASFGLDVEVRDDFRKELNVREAVRAYGSLGLPIILALRDPSPPEMEGVNDGAAPGTGPPNPALAAHGPVHDGHAVVVCGIGVQEAAPGGPLPGPVHERIVRLYVHDDQVGPYARAEFDAAGGAKGKRLRMSAPAGKGRRQVQEVYALVVPVHPLIRVRDEAVRSSCEALDTVLPPPAPTRADADPAPIRWDVVLCNGYDVVAALRSDPAFTPEHRRELVAHEWPRFVWRATAWCNGESVAEVFVDASDIERSFLPLQIVLRPAWRARLMHLWGQTAWRERVRGQLDWPVRVLALLDRERARMERDAGTITSGVGRR